MRKMVIHFGPDGEGSGTVKHNLRSVDPARHAKTTSSGTKKRPEQKQALKRGSWLSLLSEKATSKFRKVKRVVKGVTTGIAILKTVRGMSRSKKIASGAVLIAGVAGMAFLRSRGSSR